MEVFPKLRLTNCNDAPINDNGDFVLYWMIANRRTRFNFSLQRAVDWAADLRKPLVILEALRIDYPWASRRLHRFALQGMGDNAEAIKPTPALYYPYVEPNKDADHGLLAALAKQSCVIVTDDFPCFFLARMVRAVSRMVDVKLESIDSNGLLPMRAGDKTFTVAHSFRRFLHHNLRDYLPEFPDEDPLAAAKIPKAQANLIAEIQKKYPPASKELLSANSSALDDLPIDQSVRDSVLVGGAAAAERTLATFLESKLARYGDKRNSPEADVASGLSPYLHFGHISTHDIFSRLTAQENWDVSKLSGKATGSREGWWNMSPSAESFLDELITWREIGYNMCSRESNYDRYESLPDWAQKTLADHANDKRPHLYNLEQLAKGKTYDELWNAAQTQLVVEGRMHNYLRMLWAKKILEWSPTPREALDVLIKLNNKYTVDGRNPNSYSGIFWCLGRYDRAWGPERKIFGKIRYMSSENTAKKIPVRRYIENYAPNRLFR
ncbi:deoxyribodipyrimidine photolyase [Blastopirellula retiformator]|uniref:Deoxyribodipyrimidine photo-lyase n=1 Tax=Blastopirellula retiformator TaxID=2527970 RepID=A0A5C5V815_9BACT|nr:deoxyribodipyrimidine photolyase [Blastopirellula retiformator]TWT34200.1 Deoxyribodipyrimidine photo-lyase [Blastopirellula retiformator]